VPVPSQANGVQDLTSQILTTLDSQEPINTAETFPQASQAEVKAALDRLASRGMVQYETNDTEQVVLTEEGQQICDEGSHEWKVWEAVKSKGRIPIKELEKVVGPSAKVGQGNAFKLKWIKKDGDSLTPVAKEVKDSTRQMLQHVSEYHAFPDPKQLKD
jgi:phenylalanyl-tRNA synthetase alpha chain